MIFALIAACGSAAGDVTSKVILDIKKLTVRSYLPPLFIALAVLTALTLPWLFGLDKTLFFTPKYLILFVLMLAAAVAWNIPFYTSLKKETLHEFELIMLLTPISTVLLAAIVFPDERQIGPFVASLIAAIALLATRIKKSHLELTKNIKRTLLAMFFISVEVILLKELLTAVSPATLYFLRTASISVVLLLYFKTKKDDFGNLAQSLPIITLSAVFGIIYMVTKYFSFQELGVVKTTLILLLAPILNYIASYFYFKEHRLFKKDLVAALVILLCVAYVTLVK